MKMTDFARVFQPILLRLNYRLISTIRYLQKLFIHKKKLLHALRAYVYPTGASAIQNVHHALTKHLCFP